MNWYLKTYKLKDLINNKWNIPEFENAQYTHKTDAIFNIRNMKVIEVNDDIVRCTGGTLGLGHP